jgi:predicted nucleic acid-binding protein
MVLVDTSVWIEASRREGDPGCKLGLEGLLEEYMVAICGPVKLEFLGGARREERKWLQEKLACLPEIPIETRHWESACKNAWILRDAGQSVPWNDVLIATVALDNDMRAYARDTHFQIMAERIGLRLYEPGYSGRYSPE